MAAGREELDNLAFANGMIEAELRRMQEDAPNRDYSSQRFKGMTYQKFIDDISARLKESDKELVKKWGWLFDCLEEE